MDASSGTVVAHSGGERALVWVGFPLVGALLGWLLGLGAEWVAGLRGVSVQPFELIAALPEPYATLGVPAVGLVVGAVVAYLAERDYVTVRVDNRQVTIAHGDTTRQVARASVTAAYADGKQLVLLGEQTEELVRQGGDLDAKAVRAALLAHGYPWRDDGDPFVEEYRRWVDDLPDMPAGADAVFRARARALEKGDRDDAAQLRSELGRLGIVVRDEGKRQHLRRTGRRAP